MECNYDGPVLHGALSVHSCEDPVQVVLRVVAQSFDWSHTFIVTEEQRYCEMDMPMDSRLYTSYSRNVSHLQLEVKIMWLLWVLSRACNSHMPLALYR